MNRSDISLVESPNGLSCRMGCGERVLLGFCGAWMALTRPQLVGIGNTLAEILCCPFKEHHLSEGMILVSKEGRQRLPLTEFTARELHGLVNDTLLVLEAEAAISPARDAKEAGRGYSG